MPRRTAYDRLDDKQLVELCNSGDSAEATRAFEAIYLRHKQFVIRVARRFVPDSDAALDVLQETFSYILRKFPPGGDGLQLTAKLTTLLYPVARNTAISLMRKSTRFDGADEADPDSLPSTATDQGSDIGGLVGCLSADRREVVMMRFVDDMSLQDIATALSIPLGTVKSRLHLALRDLRANPDTKKFFEP